VFALGKGIDQTKRSEAEMSKLEERIKKYDIPPTLYEPVFDRVLVYQIETMESETFSGSTLIKPEVTRKKERSGSPRGVLVAAGLKARDIMESHGIEIGDIVWFARMSMWKHELDASSKSFSVLRIGEICGSEDLAKAIKAGDLKYAPSDDGQWELEGHKRRFNPEEYNDT
jgi:co-chaperonin GroES (HSP10)